MSKNYWKRFVIYERVIYYFLICNLIFIIINRELLKFKLPEFIQGYLFFFSLGLYIGFILCKDEYKRAIKNINDNEEANGS